MNSFEMIYSKESLYTIQNSHLLCIGAGGIGCELLKNLILSGFEHIHIIDMDTIDVSNLNRQFLFRKKHVGMSKSIVARKALIHMNPSANIVAHHENIKNGNFDLSFFKRFDIVLNALDNVSTRQYVNRLCIAANIPLIDSGSAGYLGQVSVIKKNETSCYDCYPKPRDKKTYPICTIRNTPDKPVHSVVWAKELFKLMFGQMEDSMLYGTIEEENLYGMEIEKTNKVTDLINLDNDIKSTIMEAVKRPTESQMNDINWFHTYARNVFNAVFDTEIRIKQSMHDIYKGSKNAPKPISFDSVSNFSIEKKDIASVDDHSILSLKQYRDIFVRCVLQAWKPDCRSMIGRMEFDKDDQLSLDFVTAVANIRSSIFSIEQKSKFEIKGIAGGIVHAIATTNAIVAGIQTIECIKLLLKIKSNSIVGASHLLEKRTDDIKQNRVTENSNCVWLAREPIGNGSLLQSTRNRKPNENCITCGNRTIILHIDTSKETLGFLVTKLLKDHLGFQSPIVTLESSEIYLEGEGLEDDEIEFFNKNLEKRLVDCPGGGIKDGTILDIADDFHTLCLRIIINQKKFDNFEKDNLTENFFIETFPMEPELQEISTLSAKDLSNSYSKTNEILSNEVTTDTRTLNFNQYNLSNNAPKFSKKDLVKLNLLRLILNALKLLEMITLRYLRKIKVFIFVKRKYL